MLIRGTLKWEAFLSRVQRYVTGGEGREIPEIDGPTGIAYLGAGYWRAVLWLNPTNRLFDEPASDIYGLTLENPDRTRDEIQAVELGVAILASLEYSGNKKS